MAESDTQQATGSAATESVAPDEFSALLQQEFKPKTERTKEAVVSAVQTLAETVLKESSTISDDAVETIEGIIAEIDKKLTEQVNLILHHEDFQKLEGSWRGLHHLV
ncbi:MAG: type VI secretion system contractile sheath large subunit, partial [Candidatus Thiodiazotropha sp. 6PLUC3]